MGRLITAVLLSLGAASAASPAVSAYRLAAAPAMREGPSLPQATGERTQNDTQVKMSPDAGLALAQRLYDEGKYDAAEAILIVLDKEKPDGLDRTQVSFLRGLNAMAREDYEQAEGQFRQILDRRPNLVRVRLELARSLFFAGRDLAARYHFRLALAEDLPEAAKDNIRIFLNQIEQRKIWRVSAQAGIAPDTNVSAGPKDRQVEIFGLPFELDDDSLERSGLGLSSSLNAEVFPRLGGPWRAEIRGGGSLVDYENRQFDDAFVFVEAGPRLEKPGMSASVLGAFSRRFFGGEGFNTSAGGKIRVTKGLTSRTWATVRFSAAKVDYDADDLRDGPAYSLGFQVNRSLSKSSTVFAGVTTTREQTREQVLRNTQVLLNGGYARELPFGVTVQAGPDLYYRRFDNFDPINDNIRRDWTFGGSTYVTKRDWRLAGFSPFISYQYLQNVSNADRFDYTRHRANFGLTRTF